MTISMKGIHPLRRAYGSTLAITWDIDITTPALTRIVPWPVRKEGTNSMLVLSRQLDESIMIGDDIVITLVDIKGDKIRLGIAAPADVPIHRQEIYEAIQRENMQAALVGSADQSPGGTANLPSGARIKPMSFSRATRTN